MREQENLYLTQRDPMLCVSENWNRFRNNLIPRISSELQRCMKPSQIPDGSSVPSLSLRLGGRNLDVIAVTICNG
jgi:hypothetical protein